MFQKTIIGALAVHMTLAISALSISAPAAVAEQLALVQAVFPSLDKACGAQSPEKWSEGFDFQGPGTLIIQDWALPVIKGRPGGAAILVRSAADRGLRGFLSLGLVYELRSPTTFVNWKKAYWEVHYAVKEDQSFRDVAIRIRPHTFSIDCLQYASARRIQISFLGSGLPAPKASQQDIDAVYTEMGEPSGNAGSGATDAVKPATKPVFPAPQKPVAVPAPKVAKPHGPVQKHHLGNGSVVQSGPSQPSKFKFDKPFFLSKLQTYHWNGGKGTPAPGLITLVDANGNTAGQWQAQGLPGMNGVPNANWVVYPEKGFAPGTYTVLVSSPQTWSTNAEAGNRGFLWIEVQDFTQD